MCEDVNTVIPLKRVAIGTFETEKTEVLAIVDQNIKFSVEINNKQTEISIKKENVARICAVYGEKSSIRLVLKPNTAKQMEEKLPKDETFCFHSKDPRQSRFILEFAGAIDDFNKCILQSFFEGIPTIAIDEGAVISEDDEVIELKDEINSAVLEGDANQVLVMKRLYTEETEDAPQKKKPKSEQNGHGDELRPIWNLRSRVRNPPIKEYNPLDFASDEEEIPEILRVPSETTISKPPSRFDRFEHFENTIHLLTYRDIPIQMEDYKCLDRRELVSNFVLDFYLQYLYHEVLPEEMRNRIHIYKTHFYTLLATKANFAGWKEGTKGAKAAQKRYERVKDLDNEVNIFERDFVVFPCNTNEHWFLAIACFPRLNGAIFTESKERIEDIKNPSEGGAITASCVLILDSVSTNPGRKTAAMTHIRNFLMSEYQAKYSHEFPLEASNIRTCAPKCPLQTNATDCGLFVVEFFEQFFMKAPINDFRLPINLSNWFDFDPTVIIAKREAIAGVIKEKIVQQLEAGQDMPMLPEISFYKSDEEQKTENESRISNGNGDCKEDPSENGNEEEKNGNENENMEENDVNNEESNGNVDENNGNLEESNGNGNENNNEEAFNNNNDFNAVDNNIQQQHRPVQVEIQRPVSPEYPVELSEENCVSSTVEDSLSQNDDIKVDFCDNVINIDSD